MSATEAAALTRWLMWSAGLKVNAVAAAEFQRSSHLPTGLNTVRVHRCGLFRLTADGAESVRWLHLRSERSG